MNTRRVTISGAGIVCALGANVAEAAGALRTGRSGLEPLTRFDADADAVFKTGQCRIGPQPQPLPLAFVFARQAADEAMARACGPPDAVVVGTTTGGMDWTEAAFFEGDGTPERYRYHGLDLLTRDLADRWGCTGAVLTVSTACASGAAAIAIAGRMIRQGHARRVLAGGVDVLCRLTYHGFRSLKLLDPDGARPLDVDRKGLSVAEGAAMVLLEGQGGRERPIGLLGAGFSCDAHHATQPDPEGRGARTAMERALSDAGLVPSDIDYINLHGTGTPDNDRAEGLAIRTLFGPAVAPLSSIKGATGHSLAAAGAFETVFCVHALRHGWLPGNTGLRTLDPALGVRPVVEAASGPIGNALSNSFGFGGSNVSLVLGKGGREKKDGQSTASESLRIVGWAAVSGAGGTGNTLKRLLQGVTCRGPVPLEAVLEGVSSRSVRRLKRFSRLGMALCGEIRSRYPGGAQTPGSIFLGTGWGGLSETHDFLKALAESNGRFASPTDFIGSVHNAAAGQAALFFGAKGANLTVSGGNYSFEQALLTAQLVFENDENPAMVMGIDEAHLAFSPLFDPSVRAGEGLCDGGGAVLVKRGPKALGPAIALRFYEKGVGRPSVVENLAGRLGEAGDNGARCRLLLAGIPAAERSAAGAQLERFLKITGYSGPVVDYRGLTGEFSSASAIAVVIAGSVAAEKGVPVLVLGLGAYVTAIEVSPA